MRRPVDKSSLRYQFVVKQRLILRRRRAAQRKKNFDHFSKALRTVVKEIRQGEELLQGD